MKNSMMTLFAGALSGGLWLSGAFAVEKKAEETGGLSATDKHFLMSA